MTDVAALLACAVLAALAALQVGLAAGRPWGRLAWGVQHTVLPARLRVASALSIVLYALFALVVLAAARRLGSEPGAFGEVGVWVLAAYFALGVLMNGISRSRPERLVMTPVALVLAGCCLAIALA